MYASRIVLASLFAAAASAAVSPRQVGNAACNAARVQVVSSLGDASNAIAQIQDPTTQAAAQDGLDQAQSGVDQVAQSLVAGQQASAAGRDDVAAGIQAMDAALAAGDA